MTVYREEPAAIGKFFRCLVGRASSAASGGILSCRRNGRTPGLRAMIQYGPGLIDGCLVGTGLIRSGRSA